MNSKYPNILKLKKKLIQRFLTFLLTLFQNKLISRFRTTFNRYYFLLSLMKFSKLSLIIFQIFERFSSILRNIVLFLFYKIFLIFSF